MHLPPLTVRRHDDKNRALITLAGEIDLETVPLVRASLEQCLRDGIRTVDVDLTSLTFCDCSALNAFLHASQRLTAAGGRCDCTIRHRRWSSWSTSPAARSCFWGFRSGSCRSRPGTPRPRALPSRPVGLFRLHVSS